MFRALSAHLQEDTIVYMQRMVLSLSTRVCGGLLVHSWLCTDRPPGTLMESDSTICCMCKLCPTEDEHLRLEICRGEYYFMNK